MVNFRDPAVVALNGFILSKVWHLMSGLFIWEFLTNLGFEWSFIQGRRRYRWTIWVYSFSRVGALATVIANLVVLNFNTPLDCRLTATLTWFPAYLALAATSFLVVLRISAIWNRNRIAVVITAVIWAFHLAFFIETAVRLRYERGVIDGFCVILNIQVARVTIIAIFITDVLLLLVMLIGLLRLGCHRHGAFATGRFLWNQGVIWLFLATVTGVLPTVFAYLDLNAPLDAIFFVPWLIVMSIATTRMYRGLDEFFSSDVKYSLHVPSNIVGQAVSTRGTPAVPIPLDGISVDDVHTVHSRSESVTSQAIRHSLGSNTDKQLHDKPHELV